jgi:hypothetical protein
VVHEEYFLGAGFTEVTNWIEVNPGVALLAWHNFWKGFGNRNRVDELRKTLSEEVGKQKRVDPSTIASSQEWITEAYGANSQEWKGELRAYLLGWQDVSKCKPYGNTCRQRGL